MRRRVAQSTACEICGRASSNFAKAFGVRTRPRVALARLAYHSTATYISLNRSSPDLLPLPYNPMQSQDWHKKEKYEHDAQLDKKQENQFSKFFFVDFEEMRRPICAGVPKQERRAEIEQSEEQANNECGEEKVPEENNFVAVHAAIIYLSDARSITNRYRTSLFSIRLYVLFTC